MPLTHPARPVGRVLLILATACAAACATPAPPAGPGASAALRAYADEAELQTALQRWREGAPAARGALRAMAPAPAVTLSGTAEQASPPPAPAAAMQASKSAAGVAPTADGITNVQTAGVDEGGIVKQAGEHLVILRRGRLFTVKVGGDALQATAAVDAYAPGASPQGAWYDELLVAGRTVVVVGFSYARGGTEIGLFDLGSDGSLTYRATYHLRSNDYFSSRNYASRLIGTQLVFYTPQMLVPWGPAPAQLMPSMRRWQAQLPQDFERILPATRIFRTDDDFDPAQPLALHTVTRCELAATPLRCEATAVLGPAGRVFYVSQGSVYVWAATGRRVGTVGRPTAQAEASAALFRLPLDGAAPSGIKTVGVPIDQLSFLEHDQHLSVLLRDSGAGEAMFGGERAGSRLALLRLPLAALGDGRSAAAREHYRLVPGGGGRLHNRHVGDWLLWGSGDQAWATRPATANEALPLAPGHAIERIEAMGAHALLVGNRGDELRFSAVRLSRSASLEGGFTRPGARQGESRTHGFFYRPLGGDEGLLGLPLMLTEDGSSRAIPAGRQGAASVVFLRQRALQFSALGELASTRRGATIDDGCKASCVDWYGNARPIFLGSRLFALMGYELVEGQLSRDGAAVAERRRLDFTPRRPGPDGRPSPFQ